MVIWYLKTWRYVAFNKRFMSPPCISKSAGLWETWAAFFLCGQSYLSYHPFSLSESESFFNSSIVCTWPDPCHQHVFIYSFKILPLKPWCQPSEIWCSLCSYHFSKNVDSFFIYSLVIFSTVLKYWNIKRYPVLQYTCRHTQIHITSP